MAKSDERIILTGFITGNELHQVFSHAKLFVLPSYHEGLPIALLEALSYGLSVLVSDIPANLEVDLKEECFFECGNVEVLSQKLVSRFNQETDHRDKARINEMLRKLYNWDKIAEQTVNVYDIAVR